MDKIFDFLKTNKDVAFATVDGNRPKVRVFQIMKFDGDNLYFATASHKRVYKQLTVVPYAEFVVAADGVSVRVDGNVYFDVSDEISRQIYQTNPVLHPLYPDYKSMEYFRLKIASIDYFDLNVTPPEVKHYQL